MQDQFWDIPQNLPEIKIVRNNDITYGFYIFCGENKVSVYDGVGSFTKPYRISGGEHLTNTVNTLWQIASTKKNTISFEWGGTFLVTLNPSLPNNHVYIEVYKDKPDSPECLYQLVNKIVSDEKTITTPKYSNILQFPTAKNYK